MKGKVHLVGAGPGDPGLLTVKAMRALEKADLVVYDTLANPEHLRHAPASAITLCVGEGFRHRLYSQEKINRLILNAAKKGKQVVRLKGGDPYLFGRGGEEALWLKNHGIDFEVVPGVTSATACAAYAGVPLTHRDHNASVTFLTGHRAGDEQLDTIDWKKIVGVGGTIVVYMGFYNLGKIAERLVRYGMRAETPVCVIEWGTLPRQKSCDGTLVDIEARVLEKKFKPPCMVIIGDVVALRKKLNWYEELPLFGKTILTLRTREKSGALGERLSALGAAVIEVPVIEVSPPANRASLDRAIKNLSSFDWILFASTNGVRFFFEALARQKKDARALSGLKIASVGPETTDALAKKGLKADLEPARSESSAIVDTLRKHHAPLKEKKFLLVRPDIAPRDLEDKLARLGASVTRAVAYRTRPPAGAAGILKKTLSHRHIDYVAFTSSSTVAHFAKISGAKDLKKLGVRCASIGPVTTAALKAQSLKIACQAKSFHIEGLVEAIRKHATSGKGA